MFLFWILFVSNNQHGGHTLNVLHSRHIINLKFDKFNLEKIAKHF
jgi:hypothetical protein